MFCSTASHLQRGICQRHFATKYVRFPLVPADNKNSVQTLQQLIASHSDPNAFVFGTNMAGRVGQWLTKRSFEKTLDNELRFLLLKSAGQMYNCCANKYPFVPLLNEFGLPDHYSSWYRLTLLHIWMALCRVQQSLEAMAYVFFMHQVLEVFNTDWYTRLDKASKEMGLSMNKRKEGLTLHAIYIGTLHDYDEGFFGDDRALAASVWRSFFLQLPDVSPAQINRVVRYTRATMASLARMDDTRLLTDGIERWEVAEQLARVVSAEQFGTIPAPPPAAEIGDRHQTTPKAAASN